MFNTVKYIALFIAIQAISAVLSVIGVPIVAALAYSGVYTYSINRDMYHFPKWAWLWDNEEDGALAYWYAISNPKWSRARAIFMWSALRNPANNLRYVPGVSKVGRPLWRKTWGAKPGGFYAQAGWNGSGFPVMSAGRNINSW